MTLKNKYIPGGWEDTHKLFVRFERLSEFKFQIHLAELFKIASKRGKVIWIIPLPRRGLRNVSWRIVRLVSKGKNILLGNNIARPKLGLRCNALSTFWRDAIRDGKIIMEDRSTFSEIRNPSPQHRIFDGNNALGIPAPTAYSVRSVSRLRSLT